MIFTLKYTTGKRAGTSKLVEHDHFAALLLAEGPVHCEVVCTEPVWPDYRVIVAYGKVISVIPIV